MNRLDQVFSQKRFVAGRFRPSLATTFFLVCPLPVFIVSLRNQTCTRILPPHPHLTHLPAHPALDNRDV